MSLLDETALRALIAEEVRQVLREELAGRPAGDEYLAVTAAAAVAQVSPGTIRSWMTSGRLGRYRAGRVLRVKRSELERFLAAAPGGPTPEQEAERFLAARK